MEEYSFQFNIYEYRYLWLFGTKDMVTITLRWNAVELTNRFRVESLVSGGLRLFTNKRRVHNNDT